MFSEPTKPVDTIRLSDTERRALLKAVTKRQNSCPEAARRSDTRYMLPPGFSVRARVTQTGGGVQHVQVTVRDISRGGMSMLHGGFMYPNTACNFTFFTNTGEPLCDIDGKVVRCVHVKGHVHDIGIKFVGALPVEALLRVVERPEGASNSGDCKYPALLSLLDDAVAMVRSGAELSDVVMLLDELRGAIADAQNAEKSKKAA